MTAISDAESAAFLAALRATGRSSLGEHIQSQSATTHEERRAAEARFRTLPLLLDESLRKFAISALERSLGPAVTSETPLPLAIWHGGAFHTGTETDKVKHPIPGRLFPQSTIGDFVQLLTARASAVAPKRLGWVVEPTTNIDGRRTNESTRAMHALFLDCDGSGPWDDLVHALQRLDLGHVVYQSGGWTPSTPKWRIVLPLAEPFSVCDEDERATWRSMYHACRVLFGALGKLLGEGFDSKTDVPCSPWFLTEKREAGDPPRQIMFRPGASLHLTRLAMILPEIEVEERKPREQHAREDREDVEGEPLSPERFTAVVEALKRPTACVPRDRRELYLALPGVLLQRGVCPDDVILLVEAISAAYPTGSADKHKDNVHNARTTVAKWLKGEPVTQIGTLNAQWPEVACALDLILPNPSGEEIRQAAEQIIASQGLAPFMANAVAATPTKPPIPTQAAPPSPSSPPPPSNEIPADIGDVRRSIVSLRRRKLHLAKTAATDIDKRKHSLDARLLSNILDGEPITSKTTIPLDRAVDRIARIIAFKVPRSTPAIVVREILRASIGRALAGKSPEDMLRAAETAFAASMKKRVESANRQAAERILSLRQGI